MVRKGQASLEYLLLSAIALALLMVSASALIGIRDMAVRGAAAASFHSNAGSLSSAASEVCALGDGNGREMDLAAEISIYSEKADEGWLVRFSGPGNESLVQPCRCEVEETQGFSGLVYVENEDGKIVIRER